jgi:hypothetical protein
MVTTSDNDVRVVCKAHSFWICFVGVFRNECSNKLAPIESVEIKSVSYVIYNA